MTDPAIRAADPMPLPTACGRAVAATAGAVVVWSSNALVAGWALESLTVLQVLALQFSAAAGVFAAARARTTSTRTRRATTSARTFGVGAAAVALIGLTGTITLQYVAFATAPLVAANAIAYSWPLMVAAWAALAPGGAGSRASLGLAVVGFTGVVLVFTQRRSVGDADASVLGYTAALGAALAMAFYTLRIATVHASRSDVLLVATSAGATITVPAALVQGAAWGPVSAVVYGLFTGLGPMAAGYVLWTYAMSRPGGSRLAPLAYATPLLSTLVLLAAGERLTAFGLVGCALIVACGLGVVLEARRRPGG